MKCIKTGCDVYLMNHGEFIHGDAFLTESGDLVIRTSHRSREPTGDKRHLTVMEEEHWFDRHAVEGSRGPQYGTMVVTQGMFTNHGYQGIPEPQMASTTPG